MKARLWAFEVWSRKANQLLRGAAPPSRDILAGNDLGAANQENRNVPSDELDAVQQSKLRIRVEGFNRLTVRPKAITTKEK